MSAGTVRLAVNAFVREGPSSAAVPLGLAKRGSALAAAGDEKDGWLAVEWSGKAGWVWGRLLEDAGQAVRLGAAMEVCLENQIATSGQECPSSQ